MQLLATNCHVTIPSFIKNKMVELQSKPLELEDFGVQVATNIVKKIICSDIQIHGVHLFSLNR